MIAAAAASRTTSDVVSVSAETRVCFKRGSSSSRTSAGRRSANLVSAMRPNAYELDFVSSEHDGEIGLARKDTKDAWRVVRPYTASTREVRASRRVFVASKTWWQGNFTNLNGYQLVHWLTCCLLEYLTVKSMVNTSASWPSIGKAKYSSISHSTISPYCSSSSRWQVETINRNPDMSFDELKRYLIWR